ncbi:MAG: efflux RND transporter periplasmic adaptor subunit [Prevotella sp.]
MMRKMFYLLPLLLLGSCGNQNTEGDGVRPVNIATARLANGGDVVSFPAQTRSAEEVNVSFRISGPITSVKVDEGDYVDKGQLIATMDSRDYQLQLAATQAEYDRIKADADRVAAMYREGTTTAQNYDHAHYGLQQITQQLGNHRNQLADTRLVAPAAGYVKEKLHEAGETVSAGMPVVTLSSGGKVEMEINISARDYARFASFRNFQCRIDAIGSESFPLTIVRTSAVANASQLYSVRFAIQGNFDRRKITPGMSAMVTANVAEDGGTDVRIPSSAIENKNGTTAVYIYNKEKGCVARQRVEVREVCLDGSAIVGGLQSGQQIVATGVRHLVDGQKVKAVEKPSETNVGGLL